MRGLQNIFRAILPGGMISAISLSSALPDREGSLIYKKASPPALPTWEDEGRGFLRYR